MAEWEDITSYSRGQRGNIAPRTWKLEGAKLKVVVTKCVGWEEEWTMRAPDLGVVNNRGLDTEDLDVARERALAIVREATAKRIADLQALLKLTTEDPA